MPAAAYPLSSGLRERVRAHLAAFEAVRLPAADLRPAGVAVTIVDGGGSEAAFVLTLRAARLGRHAGQFALPGGRLDPGESAEDAARRELAEEVGLHLAPDAVLGRLDDYVTRSGHRITPVVLWGGPAPTLRPEPGEVEEIYRVPLVDLDRPGNPHLHRIPQSDRPVVSLAVLETLVYAPTAAILLQFREVALHGRAVRVADLEQPLFAWR